MQPSQSVVVLELNELTPRLMKRFMDEGRLPNFRRFHDESQIYTTDAECEGEDLNPWVQWVTVHTGLSASEHGVKRLSEGHTVHSPAVWDLLSTAGYRVWVCGSMNPRLDAPLNGHLLPDPWSTVVQPYPLGEFERYNDFVRGMVQEHTNEHARLSKKAALKFTWFMATHGLSLGTVGRIVKQLWTEKVRKKDHWKRSALLDWLQWDVFRRYYRKYRPQFSTFFLNSTAHFQHVYWRAMEPEVFETRPTEAERAEHKDAIRFGYENMDDLLGRFMRLVSPETTIIFCTALSQQPYLKLEATGGKHFYRIKEPQVLNEPLNLGTAFEYHPVMSEQFVLRFTDSAAAETVRARLNEIRLGEKPAFITSLDGLDLMVQCAANYVVPADAVLHIGSGGKSVPFFDLFYKVDAVKSGFHHPDGMLWVRRPDHAHAIHEDKVSLRSIAPALLEMFGVKTPDFMTCPPFTSRQPQLALQEK
jgi:hypothetical protein